MAYYLTDQNETLEKVKYFTTMVSDPPDKVKRQVRYIDALKTQNKIEYYEGTFIKEIKKCQFPNQITDNKGFIIKKPNKWY